MANTVDPGMPLTDPIPAVTNDPDPLLIAIYGIGFLIAIVWNLYAYYKLFRLDHVKRGMALKPEALITKAAAGRTGRLIGFVFELRNRPPQSVERSRPGRRSVRQPSGGFGRTLSR